MLCRLHLVSRSRGLVSGLNCKPLRRVEYSTSYRELIRSGKGRHLIPLSGAFADCEPGSSCQLSLAEDLGALRSAPPIRPTQYCQLHARDGAVSAVPPCLDKVTSHTPGRTKSIHHQRPPRHHRLPSPATTLRDPPSTPQGPEHSHHCHAMRRRGLFRPIQVFTEVEADINGLQCADAHGSFGGST